MTRSSSVKPFAQMTVNFKSATDVANGLIDAKNFENDYTTELYTLLSGAVRSLCLSKQVETLKQVVEIQTNNGNLCDDAYKQILANTLDVLQNKRTNLSEAISTAVEGGC